MPSETLIKLHRPASAVILAALVLAIVSLSSRGLRRDYSLDAFVAADNCAYDDFKRLMDEFVSNEFAIIAIRTEDAASDSAMDLVRSLSEKVQELSQVERIASLASVPALVRTALGDALRNHPLFVDNLISRDGKTAAIVLQMAGENATGEVRKETVRRLKEIVADARDSAPTFEIYLAGPYVTLIDMYAYVDRDLRVFTLAAFALLVIALGLVFRRAAPALFALIVSAAATACMLGIASALSLSTALITQMLVILVMVLSVANCVHLAVAEDEEFARAAFYEWPERARRVLARMAAPCTGVMITTAVGFGSVSISSITPVRSFGLLMVAGLLVALVVSLVAMPWLAQARLPARDARVPETLSLLLKSLAQWVDRHRGRVIAMFVTITLVFAVALPRLRFESDFVKNFRAKSEVRRSYDFLESNLTPTGSVELIIRRDDGGSVLTPAAVRMAREVGERIVASFEPVRKAQTLADALTLGPGDTPGSDIELQARFALALRALGDTAIRNFLNDDRTALRINLRVAEGYRVQEKLEMSERLKAETQEAFGDSYSVDVTGLYHFYAILVSELWHDQFRSLGITVVAVLTVLVVILRGFRAGLVAMVPTALPVIFCLGAMGWTGIPVDMTTAMMLSVTMGIAVDDSVHYLWRFRSALRESGDYAIALRATHASVGRACVFTTIVIAGGFSILALSAFLPTAYFGGLLSFTMCGALAANLVLLPALVMMIRPFGPARA